MVLTTLLGVAAMALVAATVSKGLVSAYAMIIGFSALALGGVAFVLGSIVRTLRPVSVDDSVQETDDQEQLGEVEAVSSEDSHPRPGATFGLVGVGDLLGGVNGTGEFYNRVTGKMDPVKQPGSLYGDSILGHMHDDDD